MNYNVQHKILRNYQNNKQSLIWMRFVDYWIFLNIIVIFKNINKRCWTRKYSLSLNS